MDLESRMMAKAANYLILRDVLLIFLIVAHIVYYYRWFSGYSGLIGWMLGVGAVAWIIYYIKSVVLYLGVKKDCYLNKAVKDEYYDNVLKKAGYHGYISVFLLCTALVVFNLIGTAFSIRIDLPYFMVCEGVILTAVLTDDISKMAQLSR